MSRLSNHAMTVNARGRYIICAIVNDAEHLAQKCAKYGNNCLFVSLTTPDRIAIL